MLAKEVPGTSRIRSLSFCCAALSAARSLPGALLSATGLSDELDSASERRQSELSGLNRRSRITSGKLVLLLNTEVQLCSDILAVSIPDKITFSFTMCVKTQFLRIKKIISKQTRLRRTVDASSWCPAAAPRPAASPMTSCMKPASVSAHFRWRSARGFWACPLPQTCPNLQEAFQKSEFDYIFSVYSLVKSIQMFTADLGVLQRR